MTFALTKYIFPIQQEICLSNKLGFVLDNPRTPEEIAIVRNYISESIDDRDRSEQTSLAPISIRLGISLSDLKANIEGYSLDYYNQNPEKSLLDILSETWIIIRFKEHEEFSKILENKDELIHVMLTNNDSEYAKEFKALSSYCHLVSLLIENDSHYHGESFLLNKNPYDIFFSNKNTDVYETVEAFTNTNFSLKSDEERQKNWKYWLDIHEEILIAVSQLESLIEQGIYQERGKKLRISQRQTPLQKLLHMGGILKTSYDNVRDPELMLLLLVSIIEYLITRNPDTSRFNVEDSISKQFKLKCATLIHNQDKDYKLQELSQQLNRIYSQRSDLAHGNYKEDFKLDDVVNSVYLLYKFNKHILNEFIKDRDLIDYLKEN
ncbi:hypothetical protein [uncultured Sunxiuqinia sp.]|uniref:hypothetical protein n=1 Tax=uncultured Sunxiuqinia sp. TaxID=1573825 RepID=UPI0026109779|nr:hypothetical protein [uncultured Sunxiuqinia sp.]